MKNEIKKTVAGMALVLLMIPLTGKAQQFKNMTPEQRATQQTEHLMEELSLDPVQSDRIEVINLRYAYEIEAARKSGDRYSMRETMTAINAQKAEEYQAVLTEQQFDEFLELRDEMQAKMKRGRGNL